MASEWKKTMLGIEVDLLTGFPFRSERYTDADDSIRLVRGDNIVQGALRWDGVKRWPGSESAEYELYQLREGDVVLAMDRPWIEAGLKYAAISKYDPPCLLVQRTARLRSGPRLETRFLRYLIGSPEFTQHVHSITTGTAVPHISGQHIKDFVFLLPSLPEQRAIGHILGTLDDKIELNRRMNETLEAMARALFKSWFVDFGPVRAKVEGRDTGLPKHIADLFPDSFEDSELGEVPKGWRGATLADVASLNPESWSKETRPSQINYVDLSNTKLGRVEAVTVFAASDAPSRAQRILRPGDTIVGTVRPGNGSYAFISMAGLTGSTGFAVLRPHITQYEEFVYLSATAPDNIAALQHLADGGAYPAVRPEVVGATSIVCADRHVLDQFSSAVRPVLARMGDNEQESRTLAGLRDALLPTLVSGDVRVGPNSGWIDRGRQP